jgi:hypothetical protein
MKTYQCILIGGLMALSLAACRSTDLNSDMRGNSSMGATSSGAIGNSGDARYEQGCCAGWSTTPSGTSPSGMSSSGTSGTSSGTSGSGTTGTGNSTSNTSGTGIR